MHESRLYVKITQNALFFIKPWMLYFSEKFVRNKGIKICMGADAVANFSKISLFLRSLAWYTPQHYTVYISYCARHHKRMNTKNHKKFIYRSFPELLLLLWLLLLFFSLSRAYVPFRVFYYASIKFGKKRMKTCGYRRTNLLFIIIIHTDYLEVWKDTKLNFSPTLLFHDLVKLSFTLSFYVFTAACIFNDEIK